ncbi:DUF2855 domain-containing protein [Marinicauda salina]|uniref:DUF2855 domain-containing protein n=1 Tax=Marinicauda salina TaxID=2135793 RepID=A0A2U2BVK1_9PROT|nr:DUF2855 family protein [Marinicauda salina]PWE18056.1 DUF2855 domain-containing protein [Marinicauda salina]
MSQAIAIDTSDISAAALAADPDRALEDGEVRVTIERFALTANNVTYAAFGEAMGYWAFFPSADGSGRLPVWGFATIAESRADGVETGERIYGYFPAAETAVLRPVGARPESFIDGAPHRAQLPAAYNRYVRCAGDPGYRPELEAAQMVLQPLFVTSFLIDRHLRDEAMSGAGVVSLTSASSKTALALAHLLAEDKPEGVRLEALTSAGNRGFVAGLGYFDDVVVYDDIETMDDRAARVIVDFAGDHDLTRRLHARLGDSLKRNIRVGGAHWEKSAPPSDLPGPKPVFFFAPDHARDRIAEWGAEAFAQRYQSAWLAFARDAAGLFEFEARQGMEGALSAYRDLVANRVPGRKALTIELG